MKNIKHIEIDATLKGNGVVQHDTADQLFMLMKVDGYANKPLLKHRNVLLGKKIFRSTFSEDESKQLTFTPVISAACVRHAIHAENQPFHSPNVYNNDFSKLLYMSSIDAHQRGYLDTDSGLKRVSSYDCTVFEEVSGAFPALQIGTQSGEKVHKENEEDISSTNMLFYEAMGDTTYKGKIFINPDTMKTISLSKLADRMAINDDMEEKFREFLGKKLSELSGTEQVIPEAKYYVDSASSYPIPEKMIRLTDEQVKMLILDLIEKICSVHISKSQHGYATMSDVCVKLHDKVLNSSPTTIAAMESGEFDPSKLETEIESFSHRFSEMSLEDAGELIKQFSLKSASSKQQKKKTKAKKGE